MIRLLSKRAILLSHNKTSNDDTMHVLSGGNSPVAQCADEAAFKLHLEAMGCLEHLDFIYEPGVALATGGGDVSKLIADMQNNHKNQMAELHKLIKDQGEMIQSLLTKPTV